MAKTMKEPKSKLRENEKVLYSVIGANALFFGGLLGGGESGRFFLTNQRLFQEKLLGGDVRYSIELSEIADCKVKTFWSFVTFPLKLVKCVVLADKNGIVIRKLQCSGFLGSNGKKLSAEMNTAIENYTPIVVEKTPIVEEKVKESPLSDESPEDKLKKMTELKDKDLITEEDYNAKKEEILKNM